MARQLTGVLLDPENLHLKHASAVGSGSPAAAAAVELLQLAATPCATAGLAG
jgi:hypothetical protein